ncbi:MAG TPA: ABC transporter substrate-binding protein [Gaiellaceae bacterium]|nr:ABC transporter substrate-binding protein [Gaiellaceae bacterium]
MRVVVVLLAATAVGTLVSAASASPHDVNVSNVTLNVATYPLQGDDVLLKAAGLDKTPYKVKYQDLSSGGLQTQAVNSGVADIGRGSGVANALVAAAGPIHFFSVATLKISTYQQDTIVLKSSGITSVAQLKGQKVAYVPNTTPQYFLLKQLQAAGLSWSDITPVPLDTSTGLAALLSGSVAAFATFGNVNTALTEGATVLADGGPYLKGRLGALQGTYNAYAADLKNPGKEAAIADFIARVNTAFAWTRSHATQWAAILAKNTSQPQATVLANFEGSEKAANSWVGANTAEAISNEQDYGNAFLQTGVITSPVDAASTFSNKLSGQIAADEAAYQKKYPSYFAKPSWLTAT